MEQTMKTGFLQHIDQFIPQLSYLQEDSGQYF